MTKIKRGALRLLAGAMVLTAVGCNAESQNSETGRVVLAVMNAPPDAVCLRITARGATTAIRSLPLMSGQSTTFTLGGLPLGSVQFVGEAFAATCASVTPETVATWVSDAVSATLLDGQTANLTLTLRRSGSANVGVDFSSGGGTPGTPCTAGSACASGFCVDGVCCNSACGGPCLRCNGMGTAGTCNPVSPGGDPDNDCPQDAASTCGRDGTCNGMGACRLYFSGTVCAPGSCMGSTELSARVCDGSGVCTAGSSRSCAPQMCAGNSCGTMCAADADCQMGFICLAGVCTARKANGIDCGAAAECASGFCADGVCCSGPCNGVCESCNMMASRGTCTAVPDGQDPNMECGVEPVSTCGRTGACNGQRACRLYAAGTTCFAGSCMGSTRFPARSCDGNGTCVVSPSQSCSPFVCSGNACASSCANDSGCVTGSYCQGGICQAKMPNGAMCTGSNQCASGFCNNGICGPAPNMGPALHWKFNESTGTAALDASGNGFQGTYLGSVGTPTASTAVPSSGAMGNPFSRAFVRANRHAVRLATLPTLLKPTNNLTLSAWFRATSIGDSGAEIISGGDQYLIRLRATQVEFARRITTTAGAGGYAQCAFASSTHLDGAWHHVAAVASPTGMLVYLDGVERCSNTRGEDQRYDRGADLWVGRHGNGQTTWDFEGNIDDVRVYPRALTPSDIGWISGGAH